MGTDSSSEQSKRRGFSLVEAAIVLAVVGLVIGGIWWSASAISTAREISDAKEYILYAQSVTQKYSRTWMPTSSNAYGSWLDIRDVIDKTKPLPGNFHWRKSGGYYYSTSANNAIVVYARYNYTYSLSSDNYDGTFEPEILFYNWDKSVYEPRPAVCLGLLSWGMSLASSRHVALQFFDKNFTIFDNWDSQSGAPPPDQSLCNDTIALDIYLW